MEQTFGRIPKIAHRSVSGNAAESLHFSRLRGATFLLRRSFCVSHTVNRQHMRQETIHLFSHRFFAVKLQGFVKMQKENSKVRKEAPGIFSFFRRIYFEAEVKLRQ